MAWKRIFILLLLFSITLSQIIRPTTAQMNPLFLSSTCDYSKGNYSKNSPYYSNLLHTFANLSSLSAINTFFNFTSGSDEDATNKVYALYDCRLDLTLRTCQDCVEDAGIELLQSCPSKEAIAMYAECMLRYANRPIVAMMELTPPQTICGVGVTMADDGGLLNRTIEPIFKGLIEEATSKNSSRYFATGEGSYFEYQMVYCLVQCTPDISRAQCKMCLTNALNYTLNCANDSQLLSVSNVPSCQMRYDIVPFFNLSSSNLSITPMTSIPNLSPQSRTTNELTSIKSFVLLFLIVFINHVMM